jgi:methylenetetrahydrofolate reductase (NADPH)
MTRRLTVVIGTAIFSSAKEALWLRENRPNVVVPDSVVSRLENARDARAEGIAICADQLTNMAQIPGVSGANIMSTTDLAMIPQAVAAADLGQV